MSLLASSFNAAPGTGAAMRSAAARLSLYSEEEKAELREEMRNSLGTLGLTYKTLQQMEKLDNFVHEVSHNIHMLVTLTEAKNGRQGTKVFNHCFCIAFLITATLHVINHFFNY